MVSNFGRLILVLSTVVLVYANECPTRSLNIYYSAEDPPVFLAPNGDFAHANRFNIDLKKVPSLALDRTKKFLLYPGWEDPTRIYKFDLTNKIKSHFEWPSEHFSELATDPITGNIYYLSDHNVIGVCNLEQKKCIRLLGLEEDKRIHRRNLLVHAKEKTLFWIDDFHMTSVQMASMDGSNIRSFNKYDQVYSIALDSHNNQLYMALIDSVVRVDLKTKARQTIFEPTRLSGLFYTDCMLITKLRDEKGFAVYDTLSGNQIYNTSLYGNKLVVAAETSENFTANPCESLSCDGLCALHENGTASITKCINDASPQKTDPVPEEESSFQINWLYVLLGFVGILLLVSIVFGVLTRKSYTKILSEVRAQRVSSNIHMSDYVTSIH